MFCGYLNVSGRFHASEDDELRLRTMLEHFLKVWPHSWQGFVRLVSGHCYATKISKKFRIPAGELELFMNYSHQLGQKVRKMARKLGMDHEIGIDVGG